MALPKELFTSRDYFVVGADVVLTVDSAEPAGADALVMAALDRPGTHPFAEVRFGKPSASISLTVIERRGEDDWPLLVEAALLALRIGIRLFHFDHATIQFETRCIGDDCLLREDGLHRTGEVTWAGLVRNLWRHPNWRANSMEDLYRRPLWVPWNFLPRPWNILTPLLTAALHHRQLSTVNPRVLDLGCGFGANAVSLEEHECDVHGVDISPTAIVRCRQLVRRPDKFHVGNAAALPFKKGHFDFVLDVGCLHCVDDTERDSAVEAVSRVLKDGGLLFSRIYKPRNPAWLGRQPFEVNHFGLTVAQVHNLFRHQFEVRVIEDSPDVTCVVCLPRRPRRRC